MRSACRVSLALILISLPVQALSQNGIFVQPPQFPTPAPPIAIVTADFNGDGKLDLAAAVTVNGVGYVTVLLGNGDGTFQPYVNYNTAGGPTNSLGVGDFNGDGKPDLVVTTDTCTSQGCATGVVSVLLGNGDGTFQPHVDYTTANASSSVGVGDFNGDGKPDLVVTNSGSISIFLNSGTGTFLPRQDFTAPPAVVTLAVGDFNHDGNLDLALAGDGVAILLGHGDGTFAAASATYALGNPLTSIAAADLNGDGALDLVAADYNSSGVGFPIAGNVNVLLGKGDGTFTVQTYPTGLVTSSVVAGDFNGDGQLDFSVTAVGVEVFLNQGHGAFSQPSVFYGGTGGLVPGVVSGGNGAGGAEVAGDFNHDGKLDLAVACGGICILLGDGDGSFSSTFRLYPTGSNPDAVAISDLNGDGKGDVVVANFGDDDVDVFLGDGAGALLAPVTYASGTGPESLATADLNGDGKPDVVVGNIGGTTSVLLNNGSGGLLPKVDYPAGGFVAIGDLNGDGIPDIAVAGDTNVTLLLGKGDGTFPNQLNFGVTGGTKGIVLGDFNDDGKLDFAVLGNNLITLFLNQGENNFVPSTISLPSQYSFAAIAATDLNSDGKLDLVASATSQFSDAGSVVLFGNGNGTFQTPVLGPAFGNVVLGGTSIAISDFNNDGILDLGISGFNLGIALGNGDGTFQNALAYPAAPNHSFIAAGDLNGDGKPDLVEAVGTNGNIPGVGSNVLIVLLNRAQPGESFRLTMGPASQSIGAGGTAIFTVTATTTNGFASAVTLACPVSPPTTRCSISPNSILPTATGATATVTVTTAATSTLGTSPVSVSGSGGTQLFTVSSLLTISAAPGFTLTLPSAPTPASVAPGASAKATVTLTGTNSFTGSVAFTCSVSPVSTLAPSCAVNPAQVQITSAAPVTSTLTISTTGPNALLVRPKNQQSNSPLFAWIVPVFGIAFSGAALRFRGTARNKLIVVSGCSLLLAAAIFQVGCGGSSSTSGSGQTPAGNYTVTVSAASGNTQQSETIPLAVQ